MVTARVWPNSILAAVLAVAPVMAQRSGSRGSGSRSSSHGPVSSFSRGSHGGGGYGRGHGGYNGYGRGYRGFGGIYIGSYWGPSYSYGYYDPYYYPPTYVYPAPVYSYPAPPPVYSTPQTQYAPAPAAPQGKPVTLLVFRDHNIYAAMDYWVEGDRINYITRDGKQHSASISQLDLGYTQTLNNERNVPFN